MSNHSFAINRCCLPELSLSNHSLAGEPLSYLDAKISNPPGQGNG